MKRYFITNSVLREFLPKLIILVVVLGALISVVIHSIKRDEREINNLYLEYPQVLANDSIDNIVKYKHKTNEKLFRYSPSISHLHFKDGTKKTFVTLFIENNNREIDNVIEINDKIVKNKGSDTVFVFKNNVPYYDSFFIINTVQYVKP